MRIVIAPDSFKESLTALEVAQAIKIGFQKILPHAEYVLVPMADGGEGTVQSLVDATQGEIINTEVIAPLGNPIQAFFGLSGDKQTAIIEMAAASGLHLVPVEQRNPLKTTSFGTGQLIKAALDLGVKKSYWALVVVPLMMRVWACYKHLAHYFSINISNQLGLAVNSCKILCMSIYLN